MNDLEKEVVREKKYEENRRKMDIVKRNLMISRIYNVYVNLAVTLISAASMYIWVSYTSAGIKIWEGFIGSNLRNISRTVKMHSRI